MQAGQLAHSLTQVCPRGQPHDSMELLSWVPEGWKAKSVVPEALRELGAPYLFVSHPGQCRHGFDFWPTAGLGQFLVCVSGAATLATWPVESTAERGASFEDMYSFLFEEMASSAFAKWASEALVFGQLA